MVLVERPGEGALAKLTDRNSAPSPAPRKAGTFPALRTTLGRRNPGVDRRGLGQGHPEQGWLMLLRTLSS